MKSAGIRSWSEEDRPREKFLSKGAQALSDAELISILFGSGTRNESAVDLARKILQYYQNDLHRLAKAGPEEWTRWKGIGAVRALTLAAALELGRRRNGREDTAVSIQNSEQAAAQFRPILQDLSHEEFWILLLNRANKIIRRCLVSKGGQSGTMVDPKIVFRFALENKATSIILAHNHPSGTCKPSEQDIALTKRLVQASALLDLRILDHIIIAGQHFLSMADEQLL
ncbi:MAG: DNA repair protein RadC [Cytophagaceae bacterium]|jgi:DNA repair protein RadC|nr:DNA repair protein RadC [Cytophagaceae bacterium]